MKTFLRFLFGDWPAKRPLLLRGGIIIAALLLCSCATDRTTGAKYPISPFAALVPGDYGY